MTSQQWQERSRPLRLEKRYEFDSYESLRDFLDTAADLSESQDLYPDIGFGRTYANFTIHAVDGAKELTEQQREFAVLLDGLSAGSHA